MNRIPPAEVRRILRKEVGFGCPIPGCGNPYLYWHHFDPPWNIKKHHNPSGMIALCAEHHAKANAGAYTKEQLRYFKVEASKHLKEVTGRFDWMRNKLLAVVGGNFYYETPIIVQIRGKPVIWFNRDQEGYLLLNVNMLTIKNEPRIQIEDNYWICRGTPDDLECPPSGKILRAKYSNGDSIGIKFFELTSLQNAIKEYPGVNSSHWNPIPFPITVVEVQEVVGGTDIAFGPHSSKLSGMFMLNCFCINCKVGLSID